jgi:sRNA-binding carbon storage regulator CsrA
MPVHELQVGEELVFEGGIRVTVLEVNGDEVVLGITVPESTPVIAPEALEGRTLPWTAWPAWPNEN